MIPNLGINEDGGILSTNLYGSDKEGRRAHEGPRREIARCTFAWSIQACLLALSSQEVECTEGSMRSIEEITVQS